MSRFSLRSIFSWPRAMSPVLLLALLVGVIVHLTGFLIFRVNTSQLPSRESQPALVQYVSAVSLAQDLALRELADLMDSAPLFIPTHWNAAQASIAVPIDPFSPIFPLFEPQIDLLGALKPEALDLALEQAVDSPADLLGMPFWQLFEGFATLAANPVALSEPKAFAEVLPISSAGIDAPLYIRINPRELNTVGALGPAHYYLRMGGDGRLLGKPILYESSGSKTFDAAVAQWLQLDTSLGQLPAGYLSLRLYPD
jgi:hypothetical protein